MLDFFTFDTLITPYIIIYVYFFGAVVFPIVAYSYVKKINFNISNVRLRLALVISFIVMEIFWRIFCEFFMVYFKIYLTLQA
jgi:hypothetical protein